MNKPIAHCPHCGGDVFVVSESEVKSVRFLPADDYPFCREEEIRSEGKGWDSVVCDKCGRDINPREIMVQLEKDCVRRRKSEAD